MGGPLAATSARSLAVVYLARGADPHHLDSLRRFRRSYQAVPSGLDHTLFVIFKGFAGAAQRDAGQAVFAGIPHQPLHTDDDSLDIGAYAATIGRIPHERICYLNTGSEIVSSHWLAKLAVNLDQSQVGLVGASGSFETNRGADTRFPVFPNVHVRTNVFMAAREFLLATLPGYVIRNKIDAWLAESGPASLTRRIFDRGLTALVVGADGRGYPPPYWPASHTFRQDTQWNLLVHDNVTRTFEQMSWAEKRECSLRTWGKYLQPEATFLLPES